MFYKFKCKAPIPDEKERYDTVVGLVEGKNLHEAMDNVMDYMTVNRNEEEICYILLEPYHFNILPLNKELINKIEKEIV